MSLAENVLDIRRDYEGGASAGVIAAGYGVSPAAVYRVLRLDGAEVRGRPQAISDEQVLAFLAAFHSDGGLSMTDYEAWRSGHPEPKPPCLATIRNRGLWPARNLEPEPPAPILPVFQPRASTRHAIWRWLYTNGLSMTEIADAAGVEKSAVTRGLAGVPRRPVSGRPSAETKVVKADNGETLSVRISQGTRVKTFSTSVEWAALMYEALGELLEARAAAD